MKAPWLIELEWSHVAIAVVPDIGFDCDLIRI
jgi:hypothetical protein